MFCFALLQKWLQTYPPIHIWTIRLVEDSRPTSKTFFALFNILGPLIARRLKLPEGWGAEKFDVGLTFFLKVEFFWTKFREQKYLGNLSSSADFSAVMYIEC